MCIEDYRVVWVLIELEAVRRKRSFVVCTKIEAMYMSLR
jgi:hypothetical protein